MVVIVTEGGISFGYGHMARCAALGDAFARRGVQVTYFVQGDQAALNFLLKGDSDRELYLVNWHYDSQNKLPDLISNHLKDSPICVVDSYHATEAQYQLFFEKSTALLVFDDTNRLAYPQGSIMVNGILNGKTMDYSKQKNVSCLLGASFQCLRSDFRQVEDRITGEIVNNILITLGGSDLRGLLPILVNSCKKAYPDAEINVITGTRPKESLDDAINLHVAADAFQTRSLMLEADIAISSAGQTLCELAACGLPGIMISIIDNQQLHALAWKETRGFLYAGSWDQPDLSNNLDYALNALKPSEIRCEMTSKLRKSIDGFGADRIVDFILSIENGLTQISDQ